VSLGVSTTVVVSASFSVEQVQVHLGLRAVGRVIEQLADASGTHVFVEMSNSSPFVSHTLGTAVAPTVEQV